MNIVKTVYLTAELESNGAINIHPDRYEWNGDNQYSTIGEATITFNVDDDVYRKLNDKFADKLSDALDQLKTKHAVEVAAMESAIQNLKALPAPEEKE